MKRSLLVTSLFAVALSACGGSSDDASSTTVPATTVPATTVPATTPATTPTTSPPATSPPASSAPATNPATTAPESVRFEDPAGVYAVEFPAEPVAQQLDVPLPDGTTLPITAYLGDVPDGALISNCVEFQEAGVVDPATVLVDARDGALANVGATLDASTDIELQQRPGVDFTGTIATGGTVHGRTYLDGAQLCQTLVIGEVDSVATYAVPFLDSFEFLREAA